MKLTLILPLFFSIIICSCKQTNDKAKIFILDNNLQDTIKQHLQFVSDRHFSAFKTPIEVRYFLNDMLSDSIIETDFEMISWYNNRKDTIDLVAHIGEFETSALLLRFIDGKPKRGT